jgi:hypothetical protein
MTPAFEDIRYQPGRSDPTRDWALSVKQPLASMLIGGAAFCVVKKERPPVEMIGRGIVLHAGKGDFPMRGFGDLARQKTEAHFGCKLADLRERHGGAGLPHGAIIGEVRLIGAMCIGQTVNGWTHGSLSPRHRGGPYSGGQNLGRWAEFDPSPGVIGTLTAGRWLWGFERVCAYAEPETFKGFGGLFDLRKGRAIRVSQTAKARAADARAFEEKGCGLG